MGNGDSGLPEMTLKKPNRNAMLAMEAFHRQSVPATTSIFAHTPTRTGLAGKPTDPGYSCPAEKLPRRVEAAVGVSSSSSIPG